jgi:hypothetical protein
MSAHYLKLHHFTAPKFSAVGHGALKSGSARCKPFLQRQNLERLLEMLVGYPLVEHLQQSLLYIALTLKKIR